MLLKLKSIEEEAADCRAAFAGVLVGALALHLHHDVLVEALVEPAEVRIRYILESKEPDERLLRLRLFRPVPPECISPKLAKARAELDKASAELDKASAEWDKARAELDKASAEWEKAGYHAAVCPHCPWDGKTIFPAAKEIKFLKGRQ